MIKLLTSYLQDRNQCTCLEDECLQRMDVTYRLPQGSVLGSKLFLLYINNLTQVLGNCRFHLYADDIAHTELLDPNILKMILNFLLMILTQSQTGV